MINCESINKSSSLLTKFDILEPLANFASHEKTRIYLVGGTVRDLLMDRETEDLDFAVEGDAINFARSFADHASASFVLLDEEHGTARIVFHSGSLSMDFSTIRGVSLKEDLAKRDFTINAMAMDLYQMMKDYEIQVIDPYGGMKDLSSKLIRVVSPENVQTDPLRMLRAYRFAATLDFSIHNKTVDIIRNSANLLTSVAVERIRDELFKLMITDHPSRYLRDMDDTGLLQQIFPEITRMRGLQQNNYHHLDAWDHSMLTLEFLEQEPIPISLKDYTDEIEKYLEYESVKGRKRNSLLRLAAIFHDVGKPESRTMDRDGKIRFFNHNLDGAEIMSLIGNRLKLSTREIDFLSNLVKDHMYPLGLSVFLKRSREPKVKGRTIRRFIQKTGKGCLAVLLISFADLRATRGPRRKADDLERLIRVIGDMGNEYFQQVSNPMPKLITGKDIAEEFDLKPSPFIGHLLHKVKSAQLDGKISSKDDAIKMIRFILAKQNNKQI